MADPDEALIEAVARRLVGWQIGGGGFDWASIDSDSADMIARAAYAAMVEHLGLVDERAREIGPGVNRPMRRLVSRWTEVDHGSE